MPARKNAGEGGTEPPDSGSRDQYTVVLEDLRSQFKVFGEGLRAVDEKVDRLDRRVDSRFERVDRELGLVKAAVMGHDRELREIRGSLKRVEDGMAKKVDRDEVEAIVEGVSRR
jgi:hypothetical protein